MNENKKSNLSKQWVSNTVSQSSDEEESVPFLTRRNLLFGTIVGLGGLSVAWSLADNSDNKFTAVANGKWSDPSTWKNGTVPTDKSRVFIQGDVTVTVANQISTRVKYLHLAGTLRHAPDSDTRLRAETIYTEQGSRYEVGTSVTPIQQGVTAEIEIIDDGPINEDKWPDRKNKGLLLHGDVEIIGAEKTPWLTLEKEPMAGDNSIELSRESTNWSVGDTLLIPDTDPYESTSLDHTDEKRTISSIDGTTVTLDNPLDHDHTVPKTDLDTYVLNFSRNVVVSSENTDELRRGHIMVMSTESDVRYARLTNLGRTNKAEYLTNPVRGQDTLPEHDDPNPSALYPFHYHRTGIEADPHTAKGLVVDGSPGWGIVNHHAHAHISDSITYDVRGAGFVVEGGNERGSFDNCIAIRSEGSGDAVDSRSAGAHGGDPAIDDFGHAGHGFWLQSPLVSVTNCVAGGHRHQAFVWWLRPLLDGDLAEGTSIEDSRVTFHPNLPWEYCNTERPLFEAIEQGRFANGRNNDLMRDTQKIPSTFADIKEIRGNVAFGSAGGVDFSRHNFKWKHERFSDFNVIDNMTVHSVGPFIDSDGVAHEPDLPKQRAAGHQGRGGGTGVAFRYTSNVSLTNSHVVGSGRDNSVGVPFHDYLWTITVENSTVEHWDWGIDTGEHRLNWIRNCTLQQNSYDVTWLYDNAGAAILDNNDLDSIYHKFDLLNQKAPEVLTFYRERGLRVDGRSSHVEESRPDYVPFPDENSLRSVNNIESEIETVSDETKLVGLTNQEMLEQYGICISGALLPQDATDQPFVDNGNLVAGQERTPPTSVYLGTRDAGALGEWGIVSEPDASGNECLSQTATESAKGDPVEFTFECAAGTYTVYARMWPNTWNGEDVYFKIDDGDWRTAEKVKSPIGFEWHDVSPNDGTSYEWELSEGTHTMEIASPHRGLKIDEIFISSDQDVLGAYGVSQKSINGTNSQ
ncbi:G8 domain-containing protein [Halobacteriaceae bacterium SHR40]|uniref:G8 domain-containing protein n=1 Tax=Halovenus amylolytica TaxID=2500550 RepID=UPI000FE37E43